MGEEITPLFTQVLLVCDDEGLLGGTHFSVDGLKLSSNASKEWSGKFEDLKKKQEALERKVKEAIRERFQQEAERVGEPDLLEKVATEEHAMTEEEVLAHLEKVSHPALSLDPLM